VDRVRAWVARSREFFHEVGVEMRKVTWPSRKETVAGTTVVLVMAVFMALFFWVVDVILTLAVQQVL
jgi:preprotein translocase subunit SecE